MITIQDNIRTGKVCSRHDVADLLPIANKPIGQLCEENEHLLVFPMSIDDTNDKIGDNTIVDIYAEDDNSVRIKSKYYGFCWTKETTAEDILTFRR